MSRGKGDNSERTSEILDIVETLQRCKIPATKKTISGRLTIRGINLSPITIEHYMTDLVEGDYLTRVGDLPSPYVYSLSEKGRSTLTEYQNMRGQLEVKV